MKEKRASGGITRIGIDAGGTFTDFVVLHPQGGIETFKLRSNPRAPAEVILAGLQRVAARRASVIHGSTVATNALLERKGVRTALVTTRGFEDAIEIGRQNRAALYDLNAPPRRPLVDRELRFGASERMLHTGEPLEEPADLERLARRVRQARPDAVAICLLHAYANPAHEQTVRDALAGEGFVTCSHEVCPEFREFERMSTTVLNAYVGPLIDRYLGDLERGTEHPLWIMQSSGGLMTAPEARRNAVRTLLSGPAGGVVGAAGTARLSGFECVLGFDMGGTSTDVSLTEGEPRHTMEASIDGFPVRVPVLDIHTVGAGGGSIARVDEGGLLRVGPESAGADPGPACYGKGDLPTVTDAHVVLGRIAPEQFLGGEMQLDCDRAVRAFEPLARRLGLAVEEAAEGVLRVANANMERAIRVVSVERGHDPRRFALLVFGGCGGLHGCELAEPLGMGTVLAPAHAGVLSALGMLLADRVRDYAMAALGRTDHAAMFQQLERQARQDLRKARLERWADMRYAGQSYEIAVPWGASFHEAHQQLYGYSSPERAVEMVTLRVRASQPSMRPDLAWRPVGEWKGAAKRKVRHAGRWWSAPAIPRAAMQAKEKPVKGPALILDYGATTFVPPGWSIRIDAHGMLIATN